MKTKSFIALLCGITIFCENVVAMEGEAELALMQWKGYGTNADKFFTEEMTQCLAHDNCFASATSAISCQNLWPAEFKNLWCPRDTAISAIELLSHPSNSFWNTLSQNPPEQKKLDEYLEAAMKLPGGGALYCLKRAAIACVIACGANPNKARLSYKDHILGQLLAVHSVRIIESLIILDDYRLAEFAITKYNINPKEADRSFRTDKPLLFYAKTIEMVELLIKHGADIFQTHEFVTVLAKAQRDYKENSDLIAYYQERLSQKYEEY